MGHKKGFIHVIEIVVISVLILFAFAQFSYVPSMDTDWTKTKLNLQGNDLLFSLDRSGIDWFDEESVDNALSETLAQNVIYRVMLIDQNSNIIPIIDNPVPADALTFSFYKIIGEQIYEVILIMGYTF